MEERSYNRHRAYLCQLYGQLWLQTAPKHKCTLLDVAERGDCVSDLNTDTSQVPTKSLKLNSSNSNSSSSSSSSSSKVNRAKTPNREGTEALRDKTMAPKALYSLYSIRALGARGRRTVHPGIQSRTTIRR